MRFDQDVLAAVEALEGWELHHVERVRLAAYLYERIADRAPDEIQTLAHLPGSQGIQLWLRLTSLGSAAGSRLLELSLATDDPAVRARCRKVRDAAHRVQRAAFTLHRLTAKRARAVRSTS